MGRKENELAILKAKLTAAQKEAFIELLKTKQCTCGCNWNLYRCRTEDRACGVSLKLARAELVKFLKAAPTEAATTASTASN